MNRKPSLEFGDNRQSGLATRLFQQGGLYALGNIALKASGLLLAMLYLNPRYLSVEAFGYFGLLMVTAQLGVYTVGLGLGTGLLKFMTDPTYEADRPALPFTALLSTSIAALIGTGLLWFMAVPIAEVLLDGGGRAVLVRLAAIYVGCKVIAAIPLMILRVQERAGWYAGALVAEMGVLLAGAYYLLVMRLLGLEGLMLSYAGAAGVSMLILVGLTLRRIPWTFSAELVRPLFRFGVPLVMASLAGWFLNAGDRYLLKWLADTETVGLYEWAARLAGVLNMLFVHSFQLAFAVIGLKAFGAGDASMHRSTFRHYVIWTGWAALGLSLLAYDLTRLLPADPRYLEADSLVLYLALGFMAYGIYYVIVNIMYGTGRTQAISMNVLGAAVLNAVLNIILIPELGAIGAAITTFAAYLALALGAAYFARNDVEIRFPWLSYLGVVMLVIGLFILGKYTSEWSTPVRLLARGMLIFGYPFFIVVLRLYTIDEIRSGWEVVKERLSRSTGTSH